MMKGRTPYTLTAKVKRRKGQPLGVKITWSNPPRIEHVLSDSAAAAAGVRDGDLLVFVGKTNVTEADAEAVKELLRESGDTVLLDLFRPSSPESEPESTSSSRRSSVAIESQRDNREEQRLGTSEGCPENGPLTEREDKGIPGDKRISQQNEAICEDGESHQDDSKTHPGDPISEPRGNELHRKDRRIPDETVPCTHSETRKFRRSSDGRESPEARLTPLEETEEPSGGTTRGHTPDGASLTQSSSSLVTEVPAQQQVRREDRSYSVPSILVQRPDGARLSFTDGAGVGEVEISERRSSEGSGKRVQAQVENNQGFSKDSARTKKISGSASEEVEETPQPQRTKNCELTDAATEFTEKVINAALEVYSSRASPVEDDEDAADASDKSSNTSDARINTPPLVNEQYAHSETQVDDHEATSSSSPNEPHSDTTITSQLSEIDVEPSRPLRPDTPINEKALRRYGASCRPRQQVVISARQSPRGPPEPCGRLVAQRRARFEPPPDRVSTDDPGPEPGHTGVRSGPDSGPAQAHPGSAAPGHTAERRDHPRPIGSNLRKNTESRPAPVEARQTIAKQTTEHPAKAPDTDALQPRNNVQEEMCERRRSPLRFDVATVNNAIDIVDDSFKGILGELTSEDIDNADAGDDQKTVTIAGRSQSQDRSPGAASISSDSKRRDQDFVMSDTDTSENSKPSQRSRPGSSVSEMKVKVSPGQESARSVGFEDGDAAAPSKKISLRSQTESSPPEAAPRDAAHTSANRNRRSVESARDGTPHPQSSADAPQRAAAAASDTGEQQLKARPDGGASAIRTAPGPFESGSAESSEEEGDDEQELHHWVTQRPASPAEDASGGGGGGLRSREGPLSQLLGRHPLPGGTTDSSTARHGQSRDKNTRSGTAEKSSKKTARPVVPTPESHDAPKTTSGVSLTKPLQKGASKSHKQTESAAPSAEDLYITPPPPCDSPSPREASDDETSTPFQPVAGPGSGGNPLALRLARRASAERLERAPVRTPTPESWLAASAADPPRQVVPQAMPRSGQSVKKRRAPAPPVALVRPRHSTAGWTAEQMQAYMEASDTGEAHRLGLTDWDGAGAAAPPARKLSSVSVQSMPGGSTNKAKNIAKATKKALGGMFSHFRPKSPEVEGSGATSPDPSNRRTSLTPRGGPLGLMCRRRSEVTKTPRQQQQVRLWASSLSALLSCKQGISLFRSFLVQEFSEENLDFWLAVEEYKQAKHLNLTASAHQIYEEFVAPTAPRQVNLDSATRTAAKEALSSATAELFDGAQRRVQILMENDTYGRFLRSAPYLALLDGKQVHESIRS